MSTPGYGPPHSTYVPPQPPQRKGLHPLAIAGIVVGGVLTLCIIGTIVAAVVSSDDFQQGLQDGLAATPAETASPTASGEQTQPPSPTPSPNAEPSLAEPAVLVVPDDLVGLNAAIAEERLRDLGFTNIEFGSVDESDTVVILPQNWTVVSVEPAPGSEVPADGLLILSCSKQA